MAKNQRTFVDGINEINGFVVNVIRFVGAQQISETSRHAAKHWGTITKPDGTEISMGEDGMTTPQIKKIVGMDTTKVYNRQGGGGSGEIKQLETLKSKLAELGMSTDEIDAKIEAKKAEIEAEKANKAESTEKQKKIKSLNNEIKKLDKVREELESLGLSTLDVNGKIEAIRAEIEALS